MRTEKITAENADNAEVRALYESAFPKEERIPYDDLKHLLGVMPIDFVTYYDGDRFVGLTMVLNRTDFNPNRSLEKHSFFLSCFYYFLQQKLSVMQYN